MPLVNRPEAGADQGEGQVGSGWNLECPEPEILSWVAGVAAPSHVALGGRSVNLRPAFSSMKWAQ